MKIASQHSLSGITGFVKAAMEQGLNEDEVEHLFRVKCNNEILADPDVRRGFERGLRAHLGGVKLASLMPFLSPEVISLAMEAHIKFSNSAAAVGLRRLLGYTPEDDAAIQAEGVKVANTVRNAEPRLAGVLNTFDAMPLDQKILLAALLGGAANGTYRVMRPTNMDVAEQRGVFSRASRGALRGAGTGAGVAAGMAAGSDIGNRFDAGFRLPSMALGGTVGGLAGRHLMNGIVS